MRLAARCGDNLLIFECGDVLSIGILLPVEPRRPRHAFWAMQRRSEAANVKRHSGPNAEAVRGGKCQVGCCELAQSVAPKTMTAVSPSGTLTEGGSALYSTSGAAPEFAPALAIIAAYCERAHTRGLWQTSA